MSDTTARRTMVDCQIRTFDVTDQQVLAAFETVPRETFLPADVAGLAYADCAIPVSAGEGRGTTTLLPPMFLARMMQAVRIMPGERVLVVGDPSGYAAALVAHLGATAAGEGQADVVIVCGGVQQGLDPLFARLTASGRLVAIVMDDGRAGKATRFDLAGTDRSARVLFDASAPVLEGFARPAAFAF